MKRIIPLVLVLSGLVSLAGTSAAQAAPQDGYVTNNPRPNSSSPVCGSSSQGACSLTNNLVALMDTASCTNGRIDLLLYSAGNPELRKEALKKAACGTKVRLVTSRQKPDGEEDGVEPDGEMKILVDGLKKLHMPVKVGWGALARSGKAGIQHEKTVLVDDGRGSNWVVSDSGNWTYAVDTDYNDRLQMRDSCLYRGFMAHLDRLWKDRDIKREDPVKSCDGKRVAYFMPASHTDPVLSWLKTARCGSGDVVDFGNFYFAGNKASAYTKELIRLHDARTRVRVAANANFQHWSDYQRRQLVTHGIEVYSTTVYVNGRLMYNHRKEIDATGCEGGSWASQGSTTTNDTAFTKNGNLVITTRHPDDVTKMRKGFETMLTNKHRYTAADVGCQGKKQPSGC